MRCTVSLQCPHSARQSADLDDGPKNGEGWATDLEFPRVLIQGTQESLVVRPLNRNQLGKDQVTRRLWEVRALDNVFCLEKGDRGLVSSIGRCGSVGLLATLIRFVLKRHAKIINIRVPVARQSNAPNERKGMLLFDLRAVCGMRACE